jgi:hypothetical protein
MLERDARLIGEEESQGFGQTRKKRSPNGKEESQGFGQTRKKRHQTVKKNPKDSDRRGRRGAKR